VPFQNIDLFRYSLGDSFGTAEAVPYKETHGLTLLDALRPFHPLRVGEAGGALSKPLDLKIPIPNAIALDPPLGEVLPG